jgi:thymidylate synthase (FAD)
MESQRYINYSKERHGGEITFIKPSWYDDKKTAGIVNPKTVLEVNIFSQDSKSYQFEKQLSNAEAAYFRLLNEGCQPQQARVVLPNATTSELIMTGFSSDWRFLMDLRLFEKTGKVHPDMLDLMQKAQKAMQEAGIWEDIMSKPSKFD